MRFLCSQCEKILDRQTVTFNDTIICDFCQKETLIPASRLALGIVINDFVVMAGLGEARICTLHLAHQLSLERVVILQLLKRELLGNPVLVNQFVTDARYMARLLHPHIVHAYALGQEDENYFAAVEYLEGRDLEAVLESDGPLPPFQAIMLMQQIARAIDYAWQEHDLLHRDIKPANIFLADAGHAKLTGFRMACRCSELSEVQSSDTIVGTVPYMSPEHVLGSDMDVRSDLYSLGATFYHLTTGRLPFTGRTAEEIAWKHLEEPLTPASEIAPNIPYQLTEVFELLMAKNLDDRFESPEELIDALSQVQIEIAETCCEDGVQPARQPMIIG